MLNIIEALWGERSVTFLLADRPNEAFSALDMIVFTVPGSHPIEGYDFAGALNYPRLDQRINFGQAQLVPGNTPGKITHFDAVHDTQIEHLDSRAILVRNWLMQLGIDNGFQDMEQEVERWTR
jgi:hypothetical protein